MRLSAEMYEQIVAALKSDSHRDKDKRREPRVGLAAETNFVSVDESGKRVAGVVKVRDISASGVGLFFSREMTKGQRFVVQLANCSNEPLWLVCQVAYCRKVEGGRYSVGAKISQLLRADQMKKVDAQSTAVGAAAAPVRRSSPAGSSDIERISKAILG